MNDSRSFFMEACMCEKEESLRPGPVPAVRGVQGAGGRVATRKRLRLLPLSCT